MQGDRKATFYSTCNCGWHGPSRATNDRAQRDCREHEMDTEKTCAACGHFDDWHRLGHESNGSTGPDAKFRCRSAGCECADFFPPQWLRDVLTQLSAYAFYDEISGVAISHEGTRRVLRAVPNEVMSAAGLTKP